MQSKPIDQFIKGSVAVIIVNGVILLILNLYIKKLLTAELFSLQPSDGVKIWISKLSQIVFFFSYYQYIYLIPVIIWQGIKKRYYLALGVCLGSLITLAISKVTLGNSIFFLIF